MIQSNFKPNRTEEQIIQYYEERCRWREEIQERERRREHHRSPGTFLEGSSKLLKEEDGMICGQRAYQLYRNWCEEGGVAPYPARTFFRWMMEHAGEQGVRPIGYARTPEGKRARGYLGIREKAERIQNGAERE